MQLAREAGLEAWLAGALGDERFAANLARVWAGLPSDQRGRSLYAGIQGNRATIGWRALVASLRGIRADTIETSKREDRRCATSHERPSQPLCPRRSFSSTSPTSCSPSAWSCRMRARQRSCWGSREPHLLAAGGEHRCDRDARGLPGRGPRAAAAAESGGERARRLQRAWLGPAHLALTAVEGSRECSGWSGAMEPGVRCSTARPGSLHRPSPRRECARVKLSALHPRSTAVRPQRADPEIGRATIQTPAQQVHAGSFRAARTLRRARLAPTARRRGGHRADASTTTALPQACSTSTVLGDHPGSHVGTSELHYCATCELHYLV